jgi:hypothetical protein
MSLVSITMREITSSKYPKQAAPELDSSTATTLETLSQVQQNAIISSSSKFCSLLKK